MLIHLEARTNQWESIKRFWTRKNEFIANQMTLETIKLIIANYDVCNYT